MNYYCLLIYYYPEIITAVEIIKGGIRYNTEDRERIRDTDMTGELSEAGDSSILELETSKGVSVGKGLRDDLGASNLKADYMKRIH